MCVCMEEIGVAHTWHSTLQDKYMADMDELFSQVDEKRKVSILEARGRCWCDDPSSSRHFPHCAIEARYP